MHRKKLIALYATALALPVAMLLPVWPAQARPPHHAAPVCYVRDASPPFAMRAGTVRDYQGNVYECTTDGKLREWGT